MFLKRERPETDDFVIHKISGCKGKITSSFLQVLADNSFQKFLKNSLHIPACFRTSQAFLIFPQQNLTLSERTRNKYGIRGKY